jgi:hypothetical protein
LIILECAVLVKSGAAPSLLAAEAERSQVALPITSAGQSGQFCTDAWSDRRVAYPLTKEVTVGKSLYVGDVFASAAVLEHVGDGSA